VRASDAVRYSSALYVTVQRTIEERDKEPVVDPPQRVRIGSVRAPS